jgi:hypothetical protein
MARRLIPQLHNIVILQLFIYTINSHPNESPFAPSQSSSATPMPMIMRRRWALKAVLGKSAKRT